MKTISFIINRLSGNIRPKLLAEQLDRTIDHSQYNYTLSYTEYAGHATELALRAAGEGAAIVAAVGGDGSVNEVAKGIIGTSARLAIIPMGSGNGLARSLGIPRDTVSALRLINRNLFRKIDIGYANGHLFLSNAGVGFDALIARQFSQCKRRGLIHYARLVAKSYRRYEPSEYNVKIDGKPYLEKAFFINVANGNQMGYDFKISPHARLDDGILDICVMKPLNLVKLGTVSLQSLSGNYHHNQNVRHLKGKKIEITSECLEWMQIDGDAMEVVKDHAVRIHMKPRAISVITPRAG